MTTTTQPVVVWPAAVSAADAVRTVARRLPARADLSAQRYHCPFAGMLFLHHRTGGVIRRASSPLLAAVVVDMVSGRAFASDPWHEDDFVSADLVGESIPGPAARVSEDDALAAGRALLPGLLARRRRLDGVLPADLAAPVVHFGKPNWWVSGWAGQRRIEVVVDGRSGRHYAVSG